MTKIESYLSSYHRCPLRLFDKVTYHGKYKEDYNDPFLIVTGLNCVHGEIVVSVLCHDGEECELYYGDGDIQPYFGEEPKND